MHHYTALILGAGPAGCQCALWLTQLGYSVLIVEESSHVGGLQAENPYENNWMIGINQTGEAWTKNTVKQLHAMHIPILFNQTISAYERLQNGYQVKIADQTIETNYIVIATGAHPKAEKFIASENILIGPGKNIFNYDFKNKRVAILGGGDNAAENYAFITKQHPKCCHVYARTIRARKNLWQAVSEKDIYLFPYDVDAQARSITQQNTTQDYDVIIVLYGWEANIPAVFLPARENLCNKEGYIVSDDKCRTLLPHVYAIGEVTNRTHPCVVTAMADGVIAAKAIEEEENKGLPK